MSYCDWFKEEEKRRKYHEEWGTPLHDDRKLFEFLSYEVMQCGLSFALILERREIINRCFDDFDFDKIASYQEKDIETILTTPLMIHSEKKIRAVVSNAKAFQKIRKEYGTFSSYLWSYTDNKTLLYEGHEKGRVPVSNALSKKISKDLKKRGFLFLGPTVIYSYLQSCGLINDHDANCPRRQYIIEHYPTIKKRRYGEKGLTKV